MLGAVYSYKGSKSSVYDSIVFRKWKLKLHSTLCDPMGCIALGIPQARILEWVAFPFFRGSSRPRDQTQVSCIASRFFTSWAKVYVKSGLRGFPGNPVTRNWCFHCLVQVRSLVRELRSQAAAAAAAAKLLQSTLCMAKKKKKTKNLGWNLYILTFHFLIMNVCSIRGKENCIDLQ